MIKITRKIVLSLLLATVLHSCLQNPSRDCLKHKNGYYKFGFEYNGKIMTSFFKRDQGLGVEVFNEKIDSSSIKWINDCEFILTKLKPQNNSEKNPVNIRIVSTTDSSYVFSFKNAIRKNNQSQEVVKGEAVVISKNEFQKNLNYAQKKP
jgi:hypothetical protein